MSLTIQPTGWSYFQWHTTVRVPKELTHLSYASWEDALWDILENTKQKNNRILVPEFFCGDVVKNMQSHGLEVIWYPVDQDFRTDPLTFRKHIAEYSPAGVVIFHAVGMHNTLFDHTDTWLPELSADTLLIEDSVHRIVDPQDIRLIHPRHVVIDSLRKVVPTAGSNLYGDPAFLTFSPTHHQITWWYQIMVFGWWGLFQLCLLASQLPLGKMWNRWWNVLAEHAMLTGYDFIGDSTRAGRTWPFFQFLARRIRFPYIRAVKEEQMTHYEQALAPLWENPNIFGFSHTPADKPEMRGFPIGLHVEIADEFLAALRKKGVLVRFELNDSPWAEKRKVVYLPLGPHLQKKDIANICHAVLETNSDMFLAD